MTQKAGFRSALIHNGLARKSNPRATMTDLLRCGTPVIHIAMNNLEVIPEVVRDVMDAGVDLVVVSGGDGTFFHTFNGFVQEVGLERARELYWAVIPTGTINFLAQSTGVPRNPLEAFQKLSVMAGKGIVFEQVQMLKIAWRDEVRYCFATGIGAAANFLRYYYAGGHGNWHVMKRLSAGVGAYALHMTGLKNRIARDFLDFPKFEIKIDGEDFTDSPFKVGFFTSIDMRLVVFRPVHFLMGEQGGDVFTLMGDPTAPDIARAACVTPFGGKVSGKSIIARRVRQVTFKVPPFHAPIHEYEREALVYADGEVGGKDLTLGHGDTLTVSEGPKIWMPTYK